MKLTDFSAGHCWGMIPAKCDALANKVDTLSASDIIAKKEAMFAGNQKNGGEYVVRGGVAIIELAGSITAKETWLSSWLGATGLDRFEFDFQAALNDPAVDAIVLDVDSPGGTLPGLARVTAMISKCTKPVVAFTDGLMASAAYWISSAADEIMVASTAEVGSIGVLMVHTDYSEMDKKYGIKRTYITAGKYKATGNSATPLSKEDRAVFDGELAYLYSIFCATVAKGRGATVDDVEKNMADGRIFIGQQAVDAGLVDDVVAGLDDAIEKAVSLVNGSAAVTNYKSSKSGKEQAMTLEELKAQYPDLAAALKQEGVDSVAATLDDAISAETTRLKELAVAKFGDKAGTEFATIVDTGVTSEQFSAIAGATPAEETQAGASNQAILDALKSAEAGDPGAGGGGTQTKDFMAMVAEFRATNKCSQFEAMTAVSQAHPEAHATYLSTANKAE